MKEIKQRKEIALDITQLFTEIYIHICVCVYPFKILSIYIYIFTNPSARAGYNTRSIFKWSLTGLNTEYSF